MKKLRTQFDCPVELTLEVLAGKWNPVILAHVKEGARRYSELRALIPRLSDKVLSERRRDLEQRGLLLRQAAEQGGRRTTYALSAQGDSLRPVLTALYRWGEKAAPGYGASVAPRSGRGPKGPRTA
jgi:DNA-binding HxlR family transcriptional regulator